MRGDLPYAVDVIRSGLEEGRRLLCLLDFDGTLSNFVEHPGLAHATGHTAGVIGEIAREPRARCAILSSRGLRDLERHIDLPGVDLVGSHGLELRIAGEYMTLPGFAEVPGAWSAAVESALVPYPGAWLEVKPAALAVHVRRLGFDRRVELERRLRALPWNARLDEAPPRWLRCRQTLEWLPAGAGKEHGIRALLEHWGSSPVDLVLYAGDDENDAGAMREVVARGGLTLGVGPDSPPEAEFRVPDPAALTMLLKLTLGWLRASGEVIFEPATHRGEGHDERAR